MASHNVASRAGSFANGFTSRSSSLTTNAPSRRCAQRSSRTIDASAGPDRVGDEMPESLHDAPHPLNTGAAPSPQAGARHESRLEHRHVNPRWCSALQFVRGVVDCEFGVGVGDPAPLECRCQVRGGGPSPARSGRARSAGGTANIRRTMFWWYVFEPSSTMRAGATSESRAVADELRVREEVYGEGEFVSVRGGVVGVDDRDAGVGHQSAQRAHRAGGEQIPNFAALRRARRPAGQDRSRSRTRSLLPSGRRRLSRSVV